MASGVYKNFINKVGQKQISLVADALKCILCTDLYVPNFSTHLTKLDLTNEVIGSGYTAGGKPLTGLASADDPTAHQIDFTAGDITWTAATLSNVRFAIIYDSSVGDALCFAIDFGANASCAGQDFVVHFTNLVFAMGNYS